MLNYRNVLLVTDNIKELRQQISYKSEFFTIEGKFIPHANPRFTFYVRFCRQIVQEPPVGLEFFFFFLSRDANKANFSNYTEIEIA